MQPGAEHPVCKARNYPGFSATSGPNGLIKTNNSGNNVKAAKRAMSIANPVNRPKYMLGMKLDSDRIENPMMMVKDVKYKALPILL